LSSKPFVIFHQSSENFQYETQFVSNKVQTTFFNMAQQQHCPFPPIHLRDLWLHHSKTTNGKKLFKGLGVTATNGKLKKHGQFNELWASLGLTILVFHDELGDDPRWGPKADLAPRFLRLIDGWMPMKKNTFYNEDTATHVPAVWWKATTKAELEDLKKNGIYPMIRDHSDHSLVSNKVHLFDSPVLASEHGKRDELDENPKGSSGFGWCLHVGKKPVVHKWKTSKVAIHKPGKAPVPKTNTPKRKYVKRTPPPQPEQPSTPFATPPSSVFDSDSEDEDYAPSTSSSSTNASSVFDDISDDEREDTTLSNRQIMLNNDNTPLSRR
jgi:hypothetical protein